MKQTASRMLTALLAVTGLSLGLGPTAAHAAIKPAPALIKVMPLGDSITYGAGSTTGAGYRAPLWDLTTRQSPYTIDMVGSNSAGSMADPDNEGHSGFRIAQIRDGIDQWLTAADPDVVLLHLGINDLKWDKADPVQAATRLSELVDRIQTDKPGATVIVQGLLTATPGLEQQTADFNRTIGALEADRQREGRHVRYAAPADVTPAELPDQLHPNDDGYRKMAQVFHDALDRTVADGWAPRPAVPRAGTEAGDSGRVRWADFDGDGKPDYWVINDDGSVNVWLNRGGDQAGSNGWQALGKVATGVTTDRSRVRIADFDGDGKADYWVINPDGSVNVWLNRGGDQAGSNGWLPLGRVATGLTTNQDQVRIADFDGDGKADYWLINPDGSINVWLNRGGDVAGPNGWQALGKVATGVTTDRSRIRLADFDGDGKADYNVINPDGSVSTWLNRGGDGHGGWQPLGRTATGVTTDQTSVQLVDFTADTHADYLQTGTDGHVTAYANNGGDPSGPNGWTYLGQITNGHA
ncbi:FG-GAP-like repeat-containing protein [Kitasatospora kifunensis]|uniref:Lysophospholipase L1-like esterase n=1 Tax=Kitasatospora kifunensis TaxID=58351 RepID=A0A7W7R6Z2_KITKI|nr:FG-GAP-like repeat-containing protein [Kitasatospora kifunensis]MBB4926404.1 lysophospholipase L1-like esterase [Kitasatospora kifunensis]